MIKIKKGLDLPITGEPQQVVEDGNAISSVAVIGYDYHGMKPTMLVQEGDRVKLGQPLFTDKKTQGVVYTSPASGVVKAINRGNRRVFQSLEISVEGNEAESFAKFELAELATISRDQVVENLVKSGLWTALRTRPFSKVPAPNSSAKAIFVNAMDTNPLAADPTVIIGLQRDAFVNGLQVLTKLTDGVTYLCKAAGADVPSVANVQVEEFAGVHPAGNTGTHIHKLYGASTVERTVWSVGYQDVIAIGQLFTTGQLNTDRVVALAGPQVIKPRLVKTRVGASFADLLKDETTDNKNRSISGSVFGGRMSSGPFAFLGRYHNQVSVLAEDDSRPMFHYLRAGVNLFSTLNINVSKFMPKKKFAFTTSTNGSPRAMLPISNYERVMPLDILATQLLRAVVVSDIETAEQLGVLELEEEDLALCSFVCAGKYEYGPILRKLLTTIEKEG